MHDLHRKLHWLESLFFRALCNTGITLEEGLVNLVSFRSILGLVSFVCFLSFNKISWGEIRTTGGLDLGSGEPVEGWGGAGWGREGMRWRNRGQHLLGPLRTLIEWGLGKSRNKQGCIWSPSLAGCTLGVPFIW